LQSRASIAYKKCTVIKNNNRAHTLLTCEFGRSSVAGAEDELLEYVDKLTTFRLLLGFNFGWALFTNRLLSLQSEELFDKEAKEPLVSL
jgi:hypothetical protein